MACTFTTTGLTMVDLSSISDMDSPASGRMNLSSFDQAVRAKDPSGDLFSISQREPIARTATADGLTTAIIAEPNVQILPTSANAAHIIVLPHMEIGDWVELLPSVSGTGYELSSEDPATITLNDVTGGAETLAVAAATFIEVVCIDTDVLRATKTDNVGAEATAGTPD